LGITERREREREEVRRKILDSARELFALEGYERVTMRRIADAIEYSPTTIYNHFEDKDDLFRALCQEDFSVLLAVVQEQTWPADPVEAIRRLGHVYVQFGLTHPNHYRFMFMTPHGDQQEKAPAGEQTFGVLRAFVDRAVAGGRLRDVPRDAICQVLWATVHGLTALLVTYGNNFPCVPPVPDLVDQVLDNSLRGFLRTEG